VRKTKSPDDLTITELRQLMVEKKRKARLQHLEHFRQTGRVVSLAPDQQADSIDQFHKDFQTATETESLINPSRQKTKQILDRFLLGIEILAVLGLIFIIYSGLQILRDLNKQFAQALIPATLTPTPLIVPVILPSGHTSPNSLGGAQPNEAEIPPSLLPLYQAYLEMPIPTPAPEHAIQIQIPVISVDAPVVQGDGWEQLKQGVAQHIGSGNPGLPGNMVMSAHNDVYGEIFRDLDQLESGDQIIVYTDQHSYTYLVTNIQIVEPTDVDVMAPTADPTITLISCYPYLIDTQRIIVQASLQSSSE
jgi:sortase A